jgi:hypothetical protein
MSSTEEPDALIAHVRICGEPARFAGLVYPTALQVVKFSSRGVTAHGISQYM